MDIRKLQRVIVDGLEDVKAQNIVVFNTEHLSPLFEQSCSRFAHFRRMATINPTRLRRTPAAPSDAEDSPVPAGQAIWPATYATLWRTTETTPALSPI